MDVHSIFKRVLDIIRIKIGHLKGKNKWEISEELDIIHRGLIAAQRKEIVVARQNITVPYTSDLGVPKAFCSLFWIKLETRLFVMTVYLKHLSLSSHRTYQLMYSVM